VSHFRGVQRRAQNFRIVSYAIPCGCAATYFPETNVLVPIDSVAAGSRTPTSKSVIITLAGFGVEHACRKDGAPGVYVPVGDTLAKIAALGIKVRNGCTYHGVALNVDMDLTPFEGINPCGYAGLQTINMVDVGACAPWDDVAQALATQIAAQCGLRPTSG
jgi:hypothetical protein